MAGNVIGDVEIFVQNVAKLFVFCRPIKLKHAAQHPTNVQQHVYRHIKARQQNKSSLATERMRSY